MREVAGGGGLRGRERDRERVRERGVRKGVRKGERGRDRNEKGEKRGKRGKRSRVASSHFSVQRQLPMAIYKHRFSTEVMTLSLSR